MSIYVLNQAPAYVPFSIDDVGRGRPRGGSMVDSYERPKGAGNGGNKHASRLRLLHGDGCVKHPHCETCPFKDCHSEYNEFNWREKC